MNKIISLIMNYNCFINNKNMLDIYTETKN